MLWQKDSTHAPDGLFRGTIDYEVVEFDGSAQLVLYNGDQLQFLSLETFQQLGVQQDSTHAGNRIQSGDAFQAAVLGDLYIQLYEDNGQNSILTHSNLPNGVRISQAPPFLYDWNEQRALVRIFDYRNKEGRTHPMDYPFLALWDGETLTVLPPFPLPDFVGSNQWVEAQFFFDQNNSHYLVSCSHVPLVFQINKQTLAVDSLQLGDAFSIEDFKAPEDPSPMGLFANRQRNLKEGPSYGPALFVESGKGKTIISRPYFMAREQLNDSVAFTPIQLLWKDDQGRKKSQLIFQRPIGFDHQRWFSAGNAILTRVGYKSKNKDPENGWLLFTFSLLEAEH